MSLSEAIADSTGARRLGQAQDRLVADELGAGLGVAVRVRRADAPMPDDAVSPGERRQWHSLPAGPRQRDWLVGRAALKALLGLAADTRGLSFPHPHLSLTHAAGVAWAMEVGAVNDDDDPSAVVGAGIDHEPWRRPDPRMARFFLVNREASSALGLLSAWTVKEALYKAVPANHDVTLVDIALDDPDATTGTATGPRGERLRYTVIDLDEGPLAAAVCLEACHART